jgi:hypothetical protein
MTMEQKIDIATKEIRGLNLRYLLAIVGTIAVGAWKISNQLNDINRTMDHYYTQSITQHKIDSVQNHNIERRLDKLETPRLGMITGK